MDLNFDKLSTSDLNLLGNNINSDFVDNFDMTDFIDLCQTWACTPISDWITEDIVDFINYLYGSNVPNNILANFQTVNGDVFAKMNLNGIICLCDNNIKMGQLVYEAKEAFKQNKILNISSYSDNTNANINSNKDLCVESKITKNLNTISREETKNAKKSEKLWQFLIKLLNDKETCPSLIKWENRREGTFKFVNGKKVAEIWGQRKQNGKNMNYEKFTRAMRYYYKHEILISVPEKRKVYKFGPKVHHYIE